MLRLRKKKHAADGSVQRKRNKVMRIVLTLVSIACILAGLYLFWLLRSPAVAPLSQTEQAAFKPEKIYDKQLIIPKIAVNKPIKDGDASVLQEAIWHRYPERGNPVKGGNFILSGHRFVFARTPQHTKEQSFLYNIDKLVIGDEILIDWKKKRYTYKVTEIKAVPPNAVEIEEPSEEHKLTLYSCTLQGTNDGRVVVIAEQVDPGIQTDTQNEQ